MTPSSPDNQYKYEKSDMRLGFGMKGDLDIIEVLSVRKGRKGEGQG